MRSLPDILYNFHWIVPGEAARSAQAYAGFLGPFLKRHGIRTVINMRGANPRFRWWHYETRVCQQLGIVHRDVKMNSRLLPTRAMLLDLLNAFDVCPRPLLLKCSGGQDRTSFASALYLLHTRALAARAEAEAQFAAWPYLHWPKQQQRWLKQFVLYAEEHMAARSLREWMERDYSPEQFKIWLEARGLGGAFRGIYTPPKRKAVVSDARHQS
ncbi:MAG TPA: hypothetical protein VGM17_16790 [Rhizomicrobium sp.]|jgi:hypothetical protein